MLIMMQIFMELFKSRNIYMFKWLKLLQVLPGLYVGNYRDSKDQQQLEKHNITHIVAIHDSPRRLLPVNIIKNSHLN